MEPFLAVFDHLDPDCTGSSEEVALRPRTDQETETFEDLVQFQPVVLEF